MALFSVSMILCSMILLMSSHPVTILALIIVQAMLTCLTTWMLAQTSWFSYILFLIFLGGLMVLFVYIVSLAPNEKFEPNLKETTYIVMTFFILMTMILLSSFFNKNTQQPTMFFYFLTSMIFSESIAITVILIMTYLLITLIIAVKISSKFEGPLRNFTK